jgi:hypothetical protein
MQVIEDNTYRALMMRWKYNKYRLRCLFEDYAKVLEEREK